MQRWDPFGDFGGTMDRFFEEGLAKAGRVLRGVEDTLSFPVDVCETENEIEVRALAARRQAGRHRHLGA